ncbi:PEP-CTERM sorting domain-containing protein [Desulfobacula sp.]|uniref:PEP-CTERM sorting domain-containing protein n=1 Tax=Desulfobacula sp. TaxID=2593537 RepID=UPI002603BFEB|nr:PEP-CTERM sorting domain-containing protein [Desulfobacula sp.]
MKKILISTIFLFIMVSTAWGAASYTGSIDSGSVSPFVGGMVATIPWASGNAVLSWDVDYDTTNAGLWTYDYTFDTSSAGSNDLSHIIIELSEPFPTNPLTISSNGNVIFTDNPDDSNDDGDTHYEIDSFVEGNSNPNLPGTLYGVKVDNLLDSEVNTFTIVTERAPMWGNFYAKDGVNNDQNKVYAYNTEFLTERPFFDDTNFSPDNNPLGWVLVPDTKDGPPGETPIPEPATLLLFGCGLLGLAGVSRKKRRQS